MKSETRENQSGHNLLTNFDQTVDLIREVEGEAWYRSYINDVRVLLERLKQSESEPEQVIGSFYGDGGVTRWTVLANGEVRFSAFHDTGDREKTKTKKAEALGFKLI